MQENTYISPATKEKLSKPHDIFHSPIRLAFRSLLLVLVGAGTAYGAFTVWWNAEPGAPTPSALWWLLGLLALVLVGFLVRVLPHWRSLGQPVMTLSREGVTARGKPLMVWSEITENTWHVSEVNFVTVGKAIHLRAGSRKIKVDAATLKISADEYLRLCELYASADSA